MYKNDTVITTMTTDEANKVIELAEHRDKVNNNVYLYGLVNGTPLRPNFSSTSVSIRASLVPVIDQFIEAKVQEGVEVLDVV